MRSRFLYTFIFAYFVATLGVTARADDKVEFFKQFLDKSPNTEPRTSNLSQAWLREVVQDAPTRLVNPLTRDVRDESEQPVLTAVRQQAVRPAEPLQKAQSHGLVTLLPPSRNAVAATESVISMPPTAATASTFADKPLVQPLMQMPVHPENVVSGEQVMSAQPSIEGPVLLEAKRRVRARIAQPVPPNHSQPPISQPSPPISEPAPPISQTTPLISEPTPPMPLTNSAEDAEVVSDESAGTILDDGANAPEVLQAEKRVKQRVDSLQQQLEAEEQRLESQLALYAKRRDAALEKNDEQTLERIEKSEQTAVENYERRVQRLLSASLPKDGANFTADAEQSRSVEPAKSAVPRVPGQPSRSAAPVEKPVAKQRASVVPSPSWIQQKLKSKFQPAPKSPPATAATGNSGDAKQARFRLVSPEELRKAKAAQQALAAQKAKAQANASQSKLAKKRFKLWPFGK